MSVPDVLPDFGEEVDVVEDESGVEEHDGSELAGLSVDALDLLVVLLDAEHQLEVVLADLVQDCLIQS